MSKLARTLRVVPALALATAALSLPSNPASAAPPADCRPPAPVGIGNEHEGPTDHGRWLRPSGTVRAVVLFVDFPDAQPTPDERNQRVSLLSSAPTWVATSSYGRVSTPLTFDTAWRRVPQPQAAYSQYGQSFEAHRAYLQDAVSAAEAAVDFRQYNIVYVIPPRSAGALPNSPAFIASVGWGAWADGVELRHGVTFGQDIDHWGAKVIAHETGHLFGLPDLYSYAGGPNIHAAVGGWDLMGLISGPAPDHLAWHKWKMGWLDGVLVYVVDASVGGGSNPVTVVDRTPGSTAAGCDDPSHNHLDNATLTAVGHEVVASGVRVRLTGTSGNNRTVRVTW